MSEADGQGTIFWNPRDEISRRLAYFLLTGQHVFTGDDTISVLVQHASAAPVRPSERSPQPIPPELDELTMACLEKEPANRPQTARELVRRLNVIPAANDWTQQRAAAWWVANQMA